MENTPIVIDLGSGWIKAGFAGEEAPQVTFPAVVGRPRHTGIMVGMRGKDAYVGEEAINRRGILTLQYPISSGEIRSWDDIEQIFKHIFFDALRIDPSEHPVIVTITPLAPKATLEKMTQVLFEGFNIPSMVVATHATLALIAAGRTTGIVLDSGYDFTKVVPIVEQTILSHAVSMLYFAGTHLSDYLMKLLADKDRVLTSTDERASVNTMKEQLCYVALDTANEKVDAKQYELPDGERVTLDEERFRCPEALFHPKLLGHEGNGIHELLYNSIMQCPAELQKTLYANIILAGGSTQFSGFAERLKKELTDLAPSGTKIDITALPNRQHAAWRGGSILAASPALQNVAITKPDYDKKGPSIVHSKAF